MTIRYEAVLVLAVIIGVLCSLLEVSDETCMDFSVCTNVAVAAITVVLF